LPDVALWAAGSIGMINPMSDQVLGVISVA